MCIFNNNPMVGTLKNFSQVGEFDFQQFQQISIKTFLFSSTRPFAIYFVPNISGKHSIQILCALVLKFSLAYLLC
jgi:predicted metal-dependent peptidase